MVQASRLRPLAGGHRLAAENPVVVVAGERAMSAFVVGAGCSRGCPALELLELDRARARARPARPRAGARARDDRHAARTSRRWSRSPGRCSGRSRPTRPDSSATVEVPTPSSVVALHAGTPSVAEAAALLSAGRGRVVVPKQRSAHATCALAEVLG